MNQRLLLVALCAGLAAPAAAAAQNVPATPVSRGSSAAAELPPVDSVAAAALSSVRPMNADGTGERRHDDRRWVRTAKWSLLAAATGFGAYALANSRADRADSRAQLGIVGGQLALLGSVGLFIYDLRPHDHTPENIPYEQSSPAPATAADPGGGTPAPR